MKKMSHWGKPIALFTVILSTVVGLNAPGTAVTSLPTDNTTESPSNIQLAQGLVGQCRAAKQRIFVYTERSATSQTVRTIGLDEEVTLADSGSAGWIAISSPATGYVQARDLKPCKGGNQPDPGSGAGVCRKVTVAQGLTIRQSASPSAALVGGVLSGNTVKLANPKQSQKDSQGRTWIQITAPKAGWISSGFPDGNLGPEFSCP
ncbi:MAG TPA: hypothetical protein DCY91_04055 [Cyanobacteria bacterium UBA11370]|nr:hypothetical protein [Cyanobacteria bacterium UBA11370]HBY76629.1 hypothetical protein [Cyanobacteria bacterium UBA11148]